MVALIVTCLSTSNQMVALIMESVGISALLGVVIMLFVGHVDRQDSQS